jgi:hypothetical protein
VTFSGASGPSFAPASPIMAREPSVAVYWATWGASRSAVVPVPQPISSTLSFGRSSDATSASFSW